MRSHFILLFCITYCYSLNAQKPSHHFSLGHTYTQMFSTGKSPEGGLANGTNHFSTDYTGASGALLGYELMIPASEVMYVTIGAQAYWLRSQMFYSTQQYANNYGSLSATYLTMRVGESAFYNQFYSRIPASLLIKLSMSSRAYLRLGGDIMFEVYDNSAWEVSEKIFYQQPLAGSLISDLREENNKVYSLTPNKRQGGLFFGLLYQVPMRKNALSVEASLRVGASAWDDFPQLNQMVFHLQIGYWLIKHP